MTFIASSIFEIGWAIQDIGFVTDRTNDAVYTFNPLDTSIPATLIATIPSADGVAVSPDGQTVYVTSFGGNDVYTFPAQGPYTPVALGTGIDGPIGIAISTDGTTGFVATDSPTAGIFSFPIGGGIPHTATQLSATSTEILRPTAIAISGDTVYVGELLKNSSLYSFPVNSTSYDATLLQDFYPTGVSGIAVSTDGYIYVSSQDGRVYRIPISSPTDTPADVGTDGAGYADGIVVSSDNKILFVAATTNPIQTFPLDQGLPQSPTSLTLLNIPTAWGIAISYLHPGGEIPLSGLTHNNLIFAQYMNENAPDTTIGLFSSLQGSALTHALESGAPTRNAFPVFIASTALFSGSEMVTDHLQQQRFRRRSLRSTSGASLQASNDEFVAIGPKSRSTASCEEKGEIYSIWGEVIGQYVHEKAQDQTPAFSAGMGGLISAFDVTAWKNTTFGGGLAYVYSHIDEKGSGKANINQGLAVLYGEVTLPSFFADIALWGGYYHVDNERRISFTGYHETAKSHPHGWQFLPHFEMGGAARWPKFTLEPFAMVDWANSWEEEFTEHGAPGLDASQPSHYSSLLRTEAGFRFYETLVCGWGDLTFLEKASYVNKHPFNTGRVIASLVGSPGSFTVETLTGTQNLGLGQFEMIFVPRKKQFPKFALSYQGEFGESYQSHQATFTVEKTF